MAPSTPQSIVEETLWLRYNFPRCFKEKLTNGSCHFPGEFRFPFALLFFFLSIFSRKLTLSKFLLLIEGIPYTNFEVKISTILFKNAILL